MLYNIKKRYYLWIPLILETIIEIDPTTQVSKRWINRRLCFTLRLSVSFPLQQ